MLNDSKRLGALALAMMVSLAAAAQQPITPAEGPEIQRLTLPTGKVEIKQTSYWRSSRPTEARSNAVPPEPAPLQLPAWLLPEDEPPAATEPVEPAGEAVIIDDREADAPAASDVQLAMANIQLAPSRAAALLVVAREIAVEAATAGDFSDVIDQCHRALDAGPDLPTADALARLGAWAYNRRGEVRASEGNEHAAFNDFQEAVMLDGRCWEALHNRGVTLARYGKQNEALADFDIVVELVPEFAVARYNRGEVLSQLERWSDAAEDYSVALRHMPNEPALYAARGVALHQLSRTSEAASDFNTAIKLDPQLVEAYIGRGNLYASEKLYEQASADFQQALRLDPRSTAAYRSTAWLLATCPLAQFRSGSKAVAAAQRLAQIEGDQDPKTLDTLAVAYAEAGDFQRAVTYEQRAMVLASDAADKQAYNSRLELFRNRKAYRAN